MGVPGPRPGLHQAQGAEPGLQRAGDPVAEGQHRGGLLQPHPQADDQELQVRFFFLFVELLPVLGTSCSCPGVREAACFVAAASLVVFFCACALCRIGSPACADGHCWCCWAGTRLCGARVRSTDRSASGRSTSSRTRTLCRSSRSRRHARRRSASRCDACSQEVGEWPRQRRRTAHAGPTTEAPAAGDASVRVCRTLVARLACLPCWASENSPVLSLPELIEVNFARERTGPDLLLNIAHYALGMSSRAVCSARTARAQPCSVVASLLTALLPVQPPQQAQSTRHRPTQHTVWNNISDDT